MMTLLMIHILSLDPEPLSSESESSAAEPAAESAAESAAEPESSATIGRKRKLQQVSTLQARIKVVK